MIPAQKGDIGLDLVLDELLDLTLYQELHKTSGGELKRTLGELIPVETRHLAFWKEFFKIERAELDLRRRVKLNALIAACRLFGPVAIQLTLEAIESYGIRKYLEVWRRYKDDALGKAVYGILKDEFEHEDEIVARSSKGKLEPGDIKGIFLGLNDGLVEILGAVSGFFASLQEPRLVLMASSSVAVAGAFSMAAGAYLGASSEREVQKIEEGRDEFLHRKRGSGGPAARPWRAALLVGGSYFLGACIPVVPVMLGARGLEWPLAAAGVMISCVSLVLAFLSGMQVRRRVLINLFISSGAVAVTYGIGTLTKRFWGIPLP
ncbi:MAG: VIT1/CCC1 transporter family protein [Elusimicrobia bacterium]|nr:VIT1/CCC1 transporter family protein [Elusimicrobiota bacterium]